ncbi:MAG: ABC transporter ATP-binding protein [Acetobacteraceae bacterium]|nr:ABC transporter ATP-binding protein [Acetobacteraceae bacterium]
MILEASGLRIAFGPVDVVRGVDLAIGRGETVGLVGESGSGKSMTALGLMRLLPRGARIAAGDVRLHGRSLLQLTEREMTHVRGREIAMVFQDPLTALNPAFTIGRQLADAVRAHAKLGRRAATDRAAELLDWVGIQGARSRLLAFPHEFSGGMRQRVAIAIALACQPTLLIADEPTTALDVTVQAQVIDLLARLREELGVAILFISHNLDLVAEICDRVVVMYAGAVAEEDEVHALFDRPRHPYTRQLLRCVPRLGDARGELPTIPGMPPRPEVRMQGCAFAPRCDHASDRCRRETPPAVIADGGRAVCWLEAG